MDMLMDMLGVLRCKAMHIAQYDGSGASVEAI